MTTYIPEDKLTCRYCGRQFDAREILDFSRVFCPDCEDEEFRHYYYADDEDEYDGEDEDDEY
jgi:RNA polymerase subunit RPABC4/transcription elongation factor Spt4